MPALLSSRERWCWLAGFLIVAGLLVAMKFASQDSDSVRYAALSVRLSMLPMRQWIAPEWWGMTTPDAPSGYFIEHPAGLFFVPAALSRVGVPPEQGAYVFGAALSLLALVLTAKVIAELTSPAAARASLVLLQIMPVAFIFRIRDNQEYPMLACLMAALLGLSFVTRSWKWILGVVAAVACGLLVKGVFVVLILLGAFGWIAVNPSGGSRARQCVALAVACLAIVAVAVAYDAWYAAATGAPFWRAYWARQLGPMRVGSAGQALATAVRHFGLYAVRLLFHPAPWSVVLVWIGWRRRSVPREPRERRGAIWAIAFTVASIALLCAASRYAERYAFSTIYVVGAMGSAVAYRTSPWLRERFEQLDAAVPALPAIVWTVLMLLRLAVGPLLPRM